MNFDRNLTITDEYFATALQIFDCCGVESSGSLRVDALMDKFAPSVKTNKAELSFLKSLLDPDQSNPDINVTKLAKALHKYSENQKTKVDLDESFNLKSGQGPQDSDSGISSDGIQLLEDLQCELREKDRLTHKLRTQLDYTDRQHEESVAALTAERDSLLRHLNMVRDENATLAHVRRDYDESCERLCASETALAEIKRELDSLKKRARVFQEQVASLENDKLTLQELLSKSKDECHRINEMYASRQSALLEENETFKAEHADLTSRFQDQEEFMQQLIKEKVLLEMELKDVVNKSNQTHLPLDRSIDVSYTDDQMLTALDTLNSDSRFAQEHRLLDEESFLCALKGDQGRSTNISLFDEIRLSICNMSRLSESCDKHMDSSLFTNSSVTGTQTDEIELHDMIAGIQSDTVEVGHGYVHGKEIDVLEVRGYKTSSTQTDDNLASTQTDDTKVHIKIVGTQTDLIKVLVDKAASTQTDDIKVHNKIASTQTNLTKVLVDKVASTQTDDIQVQVDEITGTQTDETTVDVDKVASTQTAVIEGLDTSTQTDDSLDINKPKINKTLKSLDAVETQTEPFLNGDETEKHNTDMLVTIRNRFEKIAKTVETQTDSREHQLLLDRNKDNKLKLRSTETQTLGVFLKRPFVNYRRIPRLKLLKKAVETQTDSEILVLNNNSHIAKCYECEIGHKYTANLERDINYSKLVSEVQSEIAKYEENLELLQRLVNEGDNKNRVLQTVVKDLTAKIDILEKAGQIQRKFIDNILEPEVCSVQCQTDCDQSSVSTQVELACTECEKRNAVIPNRSLKRFFWEPIKCLFQLFAVICFFAAVCILCGVVKAGARGCRVAPWRWLHAQDIIDLLFRVEYTAEVPM